MDFHPDDLVRLRARYTTLGVVERPSGKVDAIVRWLFGEPRGQVDRVPTVSLEIIGRYTKTDHGS